MSSSPQNASSLAIAAVLASVTVLAPARSYAAPQIAKFTRADGSYLVVEVLDNDLLHFEYSAIAPGPSPLAPITTSVMVDKTDYAGSSVQSHSGNVVRSKELQATVVPSTLCVTVRDLVRATNLTTICPESLAQDWKTLTLARRGAQNAYGLGQQFKTLGAADGDWIGKVREAQPAGQEQQHGNGFVPFGSAGMVGNTQFPVLYARSSNANYAIFLDNVYKQEWDLRGDPWKVGMWGDQIRFYVMSGPDLPDLRKDYLELVGRPPVPPRKAFGLWVSEFGYDGWPRIDSLKNQLRAEAFPLDGFVLDLYWFGGFLEKNPNSPMGRLDWDVSCTDDNAYCFPDPGTKIQQYLSDHVGLIAIEESYVSRNVPTYGAISAGQTPFAFARDGHQKCTPSSYTPIVLDQWFGQASQLDWSDPAVGSWIHDQRRFPNLVLRGISGHWTDLGEPEKYDPNACYDGIVPGQSQHGDVHNIYNLLWNRSIYEGYRAKNAVVNRRPFIVTRSGAPGTQRYGAAMWSGDIGSNLDLLATHLNAQMHMSFSGIDYYGADIGGFRREGMPNNQHHGNRQYERELYTQWFANGAWFDVPVRPHTNNYNVPASYQTAPHLVGAKASNLSNIRQRYELIPYYYSLAYRAFLQGEPLVAPLALYYQNDPNVRVLGHEKLIGRELLVGAVAKHGEYQRDVYLPAGTWVNYHSHEWKVSRGEWLRGVPVYRDGLFRLPVFVRAGALLPQMHVTDQTLDAFGHTKSGGTDDTLVVRVYPSPTATQFTLFEDDGSTLAFDGRGKPSYATRTTELAQQRSGSATTVTVGAASGSYTGAPATRNTEIRIVLPDLDVTQVQIDGQLATEVSSAAAYRGATGKVWRKVGANVVHAKSGVLSVSASKTFAFTTVSKPPRTSMHFVCDNGWTQPGEVAAVAGNIAELGGWDPARAPALQPNIYFDYIANPPAGTSGPGPSTPKWTGVVAGLPPATTLEWKCVVRNASGAVVRWEQGPNHVVKTGASGFAGSTAGAL
jgi:alpha-glucosidase (family GH31 glycosyl hydrolase)